jgi:hypothetical protein
MDLATSFMRCRDPSTTTTTTSPVGLRKGRASPEAGGLKPQNDWSRAALQQRGLSLRYSCVQVTGPR